MTVQKDLEAAGDCGQGLTRDELVVLVGDLGDAKIAEILSTGATAGDVNEAIAWAEAESDVMGKLGKRLSGSAARVYDILMTRKEVEPER